MGLITPPGRSQVRVSLSLMKLLVFPCLAFSFYAPSCLCLWRWAFKHATKKLGFLQSLNQAFCSIKGKENGSWVSFWHLEEERWQYGHKWESTVWSERSNLEEEESTMEESLMGFCPALRRRIRVIDQYYTETAVYIMHHRQWGTRLSRLRFFCFDICACVVMKCQCNYTFSVGMSLLSGSASW